MLGAVLIEPFKMEIVERDLPPLRPTEVLVHVSECGVCASDIDFWSGKSDRPFPEPLGHEPTGYVLEIGSEVVGLQPGDRVACWVVNGGFSQNVITEERFCVAIGDSVAGAVVAEPLSCVVNAIELAAPDLADDVVIIGGGFMGNLLQLALRLRGPRTVTVVDVRKDALKRAALLGATATIDSTSEDVLKRIGEITDGKGADVTFEVTGVQAGLDLVGQITRMSGKLGIVGYHQGGSRSIPLGNWNWMAFQLVNAHFRDQNTIIEGMRKGLRLIDAGALDVTPLLSDVFPLVRIQEAFEAAAEKAVGFVKAIVEPGE